MMSAPAIVITGAPPVGAELNSFKIPAQDKVGHSCDRVRAIHNRRAAGEDIDALQQRHRDGIGIDHIIDIERDRAASVDQHQSAVIAKPAHVDGGGTGATEINSGAH